MPREPHQEPRQSDDPLEGQLFWSRRGGRDLSAEVDYDRPCPACGYNLRGMPIRSRCPECGALGGWHIDDEPVAWEDRQTPWAFISSCFDIVLHPHWMARHVWRNERMNLRAAQRFRRIALTIGSISLAIVAFIMTVRTTNLPTACFAAPFQAMAIIVWLNAVTLEPLTRMKDWSSGNSTIARRMQAIVHYTTAALALSPLHVALVLLLGDLLDKEWLLLAAMLLCLLLFQLWLGAISLGWLIYELIEMPKVQAQTIVLGPIFTAAASASIVLVGFSSTIAMLAARFLGTQ